MADVSILYKGSAISEFSSSLTKKVNTKGKYCEDDITIVYTKPITPTYSITKTLTNVTTTNDDTKVIAGGSFYADLTSPNGYAITNITVTMGGVDVTEQVFKPGVGGKGITANGVYSASDDSLSGYDRVVVNVEPNLGTKSITENGTYTASSDSLDGYSSVTVNVPTGGDAPELQSKTATYTPNASTQTETIIADTGYDGLSSVGVTVNPIPSEYVIPSGTKSITENGTYDVAAFASAMINVASSGGSGLEYDAGTFTLASDYGGGTGGYSIPHNLGEIPAVIIVWTDYFDDKTHTTTKNSNIGYVYLRGFSALPQRLSNSATSSGGLAAMMTIVSGERKVFFGSTSSAAYMPQNQQPTATNFKLSKKQYGTSTYWIGGITYNYIVIKKWW